MEKSFQQLTREEKYNLMEDEFGVQKLWEIQDLVHTEIDKALSNQDLKARVKQVLADRSED